ncbi:hypothetical protein [Thalassobium sp. R2A62]|jgi:hypothetical protein|uniref:hypothetical protein n=1 Tax=Thalassobium sp. R2A62 TaxID=633131 RepID=UPI0001B1D298|nr:hypothetical protein [Thalassobium sp. R2A62]EET48174.1 hypothetical protein TR2A62_3528 [Thalassobium sp. R2A62]MDG1340284.1 hypothetical protein [Paracoccaceae bacterium]MDG1800983.1 hypothetical protein [Paracoccaceae bacterium]MDG2453424.1 hypothetical protein [Paracoccaceae bacterium]
MTQKKDPKSQPTEAERREQRLKAALKANMGRRKAQARARTAPSVTGKEKE